MNFIRTAIDNEDLKSIQESEEITSPQLFSCLAYAVHRKRFDIVNYIESECSDIHDIWYTCAFDAARDGYIDAVKYAESKSEDRISLMDGAAYAAENGHLDILKYIVSKGHVNWKYYLKRAKERDQKEIIEWCEAEGHIQLSYYDPDQYRYIPPPRMS